MKELILGPENFNFQFDISAYDDIALLFSGGADSTLLLYLLLLENQNLSKQISTYVIDRHNKPVDRAQRVHTLVTNKLNVQTKLQVLTVPQVEQHREVITGSKILSETHKIVMSGVNKYPSDQSIRPNHIFQYFQDTETFKLPFKELEKYHIIDAFYKLGIEDLLSYTHSCGLQLTAPCQYHCFNCRERVWAYKILGRVPNLGV